MKPNKEKVRCELTFSVGMFFGVHLLVILLALQMFLSAEVSCSEKSGGVPGRAKVHGHTHHFQQQSLLLLLLLVQ